MERSVVCANSWDSVDTFVGVNWGCLKYTERSVKVGKHMDVDTQAAAYLENCHLLDQRKSLTYWYYFDSRARDLVAG